MESGGFVRMWRRLTGISAEPNLVARSWRLTGKVITLPHQARFLVSTAAPPESLLVKWRSHAGCGFNLSTVCFL
jgi:hypothetical protein